MSSFRDFWVNVVGVHQPKLKLHFRRRHGAHAVKDSSQQAAPVEDQFAIDEKEAEAAEREAEIALFKAQVMERLAALAGRFKQAMADKGPDTEQLQMLVGMIRSSIGKHQFSKASEGLDLLEVLLDEHTSPAPTEIDEEPVLDNPEAPPDTQENVGDNAEQKVSDNAGRKESLLGLPFPIPNPSDIFDALSFTGKISNETAQTLQLDPSSIQDTESGEFKSFPDDTVNPQQKSGEFRAENVEIPIIGRPKGVDITARYFIDEQKTAWVIHFVNPRVGKPHADAHLEGPNAGNFEAPQPVTAGNKDAKCTFTLKAKGGTGPGPQPPGPQPPGPQPGPQQEISASCLITVTNNTQVVLTLSDQNNERGDFMTNPGASIQPGGSTSFVFVQTPHETDPKQGGCKGTLTWEVGSPVAAIWRFEWDNPVGQKNTAQGTIDPQNAGFKSLEQAGQGDENVPIAFTISGGGQAPVPVPPIPVPPVPVPPVPVPPIPVPPIPVPPEPEEAFDPPPKEKDPTLRLGDNSVDGWVEYLQQQLNILVVPSPNLPENGNFDQKTLKAVRDFQKQAKIQVDGTVGNQTWAALRHGAAQAPSTDGRAPHTFVDKGAKARWFWEKADEICIYESAADELSALLCSVGDAQLQGSKGTFRITAPGSKPKVVKGTVGPPVKRTPDDQGNVHEIRLAKFKQTFPSTPPGARSVDYIVEAYFDKELGGDHVGPDKIVIGDD